MEPKRSRATVRELAERFLREYVDVYLKDGTAVNYRHCINAVIVPALGAREFDTVTRRDAQTLHASLRATPCTADYVLSVLGSFYTRILIDWEMSEMRNPTHAIKRFGSHKRERFLSPEERRRLREVMDAGLRTPAGKAGHIEPVSAWALQLLAMTGLRRDEIRQLTWPSIDWQHGQLRLHDTKTGPRTVTISSQVIALLKEIHDRRGNPRSGRVVPSRTGNTLRSLNTTWLRLREAAGIPDVRLHDLRHSFASDALMGGVPLAIVGEMLGHRQPSTTTSPTTSSARPSSTPPAASSRPSAPSPPRCPCPIHAAARYPVDRSRATRRPPPRRRRPAGEPARSHRRHPLGATHARPLARHPGGLRGLDDLLALVQALVRRWHLGADRGSPWPLIVALRHARPRASGSRCRVALQSSR